MRPAQSMNCEGPNTHKEEDGAVERGHAVESSDGQELGSRKQHAPIPAPEGGSGEQHLVQPEANKEQPIDK